MLGWSFKGNSKTVPKFENSKNYETVFHAKTRSSVVIKYKVERSLIDQTTADADSIVTADFRSR